MGCGGPEEAAPAALTFTFVKPVDRPGATYVVQQSPDLVNWSPATDTLVSFTADTETRTVTVPVNPVAQPNLFFRLSVTVGP